MKDVSLLMLLQNLSVAGIEECSVDSILTGESQILSKLKLLKLMAGLMQMGEEAASHRSSPSAGAEEDKKKKKDKANFYFIVSECRINYHSYMCFLLQVN